MKVFITRKIPQTGIDYLKENGLEVEISPYERNLTREELITMGKDADGVISLLGDNFDREVIDSFPNVKIIANYAVGYNNIDIDYCKKKGIYVTNTPDVLTETTADLAFALLMAVARRIVEADKFLREGKFKGWEPELLLGYDIYGKKLGIIGLGRIGSAIARRSQGFQMEVFYYSRTKKEELEKKYGYQYLDLDELLKTVDYLVISCPLTPQTKHLLTYEKFKLMKKSSFLINIARGAIVKEEDLVKALQEGEIAGAGLDVFENEPAVTPQLLDMDNVVLLPHIGSASYETRSRMALMVARNITAVLKEGKTPPNLVW